MAVLLLAVLAGALTLPGAWRETQRREAYLPALERQAARAPEDGPLLALVGARRLEAGEDAGAADALLRAIAAGESTDEVWRAQAAAAAASGDRSRALGDLRMGLRARPESAALQGALAQARVTDPNVPPPVLAQAIEPRGAGALVERYAAGSALNGLAEWWGRRHPSGSGYATRQAWAATRPGDAEAQRLWGEALLTNRRPKEAQGVLALALSLAPASPAVHLALARSYMAGGDAPKAALEYLTCLGLRPQWLPALLGFGEASLTNHLTPNAIAAYTRATQIAPQNADGWIGLGRAQLQTGVAFDPAIAAFEAAAKLAPTRTDYLNEYGDALRRRSRGPEAEAVIRRRLQSTPSDALAHYLLGLILRNTDPTPARVAESEAETREALRLSPGNPLAETQLAQLLLDKGQTADALTLLQDAQSRTPHDANLLLLLARVSQKAGRTADSARFAAQAQRLTADRQHMDVLADQARHRPLDLGLHRQLAALYARLGEPDKARRESDTVRLLQADPQGTARQLNAFSAQVEAALSGK